MINQYVASGDITGNAEKGLLAKLDAIKQKILNGQFEAAANQFGALINEVQAQQGKKISAKAATTLIALVQQASAEIQSAVPAIAGTATSVIATLVSPTTPLATSASMPAAPMPRGDKLQHQTQWDTIANSVAKLVGFTTFSYDLYKLPANTTWADTLAYYDTQAAAAGWGATHTQVGEIPDGHFAIWKMITGGTTSNFVVAQMDTTEGSFTLNLLGQ